MYRYLCFLGLDLRVQEDIEKQPKAEPRNCSRTGQEVGLLARLHHLSYGTIDQMEGNTSLAALTPLDQSAAKFVFVPYCT